MCPRHQRYAMRSHFQRMKSVFGFQACRRFKSTIPSSFFIVKPPRNAKPSHSTRQPRTLYLPQLKPYLLNPVLLPRPQRKYLETNLLDNVKISTPERPFPDLFTSSQETCHQRCKPNLVRVSPAKILQSTELFHHPRAPFRYVNRRSEAPPFSRCLVNNTGLSPSSGPDATADLLHVM